MTSIGSLTATVEAKAGAFSKAMNAAANSTGVFRKKAKANADKTGRAIADNVRKSNAHMNSVERNAKIVGKSASRSFSKVKSAALALAPAISAVAAVSLVKNAVAGADALAKQAKVIDLTVEKLQTLRFAFERQGVSVQQTDKALQQFTTVLGRARVEGGMYEKAFTQAGVSINQTTEGALSDTLKKLAEIEDQSTRSGIAAQLFGSKAGPKLAAAVGQGTNAIADLEAEARSLGIITNEAAANAEALADQFTNLQQLVSSNLSNAILENADAIYAIVDAATKGVVALINLTGELARLSGSNKALTNIEVGQKAQTLRADIIALEKFIDDNAARLLVTDGILGTKADDEMMRLKKLREEYEALRVEMQRREDVQKRLNSATNIKSNVVPFERVGAPSPVGVANDNSRSLSAFAKEQAVRSANNYALAEAEAYTQAKESYAEYFTPPLSPIAEVNTRAQQLQSIVEDALEMRVISEREAADQIKGIWADAEKQKQELAIQSVQRQMAANTQGLGDAAFALKAFFGENNKAAKTAFTAYKVAASAEAAIAGVLAVQKAASALPFPANVPGIAIETARAAASIASINSQGFRSGGYTGDGNAADVAGVVHGKEFVINENATKANRPLLEAMNRGVSVNGIGQPANDADMRVNIGVNVSASPYFDVAVEEISSRKVVPIQKQMNTLANAGKTQARAIRQMQR